MKFLSKNLFKPALFTTYFNYTNFSSVVDLQQKKIYLAEFLQIHWDRRHDFNSENMVGYLGYFL